MKGLFGLFASVETRKERIIRKAGPKLSKSILSFCNTVAARAFLRSASPNSQADVNKFVLDVCTAATSHLGLLVPDPAIDALFKEPDYATVMFLSKNPKTLVTTLLDQARRVLVLEYINQNEAFKRISALVLVLKIYLKTETTETVFPKLGSLAESSWVQQCLRTIEKGETFEIDKMISRSIADLNQTTATLFDKSLPGFEAIFTLQSQWAHKIVDPPINEACPSMGIVDLRDSSERDIELAARKELDPENERYAIELVALLISKVSGKSLTEEATNRIREIGLHLGENGGDKRMKQIAYRVQFLGGSSRLLELYWNGICGWQS